MKVRISKIITVLITLAFCIFLGLFIMAILGEWSYQAIWALLSGWATYPFKILPQISYNIEMILCGITALALAIYFAHRFLKWLAETIPALPTPWSFKYTFSLSFLLLSMFGTSIAMTGIIHQSAWLATSGSIIHTRGIWETGTQQNEAKNLLYRLYENAADQADHTLTLPPTLDLGENPDHLDSLCSYRRTGREPWLFPGAGKTLGTEENFPVIISPRPNNEGRIVVGYSNLNTEHYLVEELPPQIATSFK